MAKKGKLYHCKNHKCYNFYSAKSPRQLFCQKICYCSYKTVKTCPKILHPEALTVDSALILDIPLFKVSAIYILYLNNDVVYIGMTRHLIDRIANHIRKNVITFDRVKYIPITNRFGVKSLETYLIQKYDPPHNRYELGY